MLSQLRQGAALLLVRFGRGKRCQALHHRLLRFALMGLNIGGVRYANSGETAALQEIRERISSTDGVIFDVGANVGEYWRQVRKTFGSDVDVYCFEPCPGTFKNLVPNLAVDSRAHPHQLALGSSQGSIMLYSHKEANDGLATTLPTGDDREFQQSVPLETVATFCRARGIARIRLLKIDVEGAEYEVLLGAGEMLANGQVGAIQFEFGTSHLEARRFLRDYFELLTGFDFYRVVSDGLYPVRYSRELEQFSDNANYVAISRIATGKGIDEKKAPSRAA